MCVCSHPWSHVTSAFWRKYPNPLATHVKQIDCYERKLVPTGGAAGSSDPQRMLLVTNRLVACESPIPSWMASVRCALCAACPALRSSPLCWR